MGITYILTISRTPKRSGYLISIAVLILFMFITGFTASVVRAAIMGIIMIFAKVIYRKPDTINSIAVSLIIILIFNPFTINDVGIQLSYLGTLGIVFLNLPISKLLSKFIKPKFAKILSITISAQIMVLPVTILNFNTISASFIIANITAVPLAGLIILVGYVSIGAAIIYMPFGKIIGKLLEIIIKALILIAKYSAKLPLSSITVITPSIIFIIEYYMLIYCILKKKYVKLITVIIILTILTSIIINIMPKPLTIHLIDVGQRRLYSNYYSIKQNHYN